MQARQASAAVAAEEFLRARFYGLLATLLAAPPSVELLHRLASLQADDTPLGQALGALAETARRSDPTTAEDEFARLFIGLVGGELTPYASWYLTGFLNEKPLADLRADMARLGVESSPGNVEPEDHAACLFETMQGLITGVFDAPLPLAGQKQFFARHIQPWAPRFMADLERAAGAGLYRPVGAVGRIFLEIEVQAFEMV